MITERTQDVQYNLPVQIKWWLNGEGWLHRNGHFNFNHYCNVVHAKYEKIRNKTLLPTTTELPQKGKNIRCRSVFPTPR